MFRAPDPWEQDVKRPPPKCGFAPGFEQKYTRVSAKTLGKGGFGEVCICTSNATGTECACKSISKVLDVPNISAAREAQHINNIKREVAVLRKLRGTLNVVYLEDVFEDDKNVYIVMELCRGGELLQKINNRHYSERTVASYMRAVLRTIAQCHHHRILHRDIKPGNFMLLTDAEDAPVKAIDFGLALFFDPKALPMSNLGLEGTPHYMAPEILSSEVWPASDVWAAGVMTYQLLSGRFPFDDWKNSKNPALSQLWKSILTEEPKFTGPAWADVSENAKDFIRQLLIKDPKTRPTAQEALAHPWLEGKSKQRVEGKPLAATIVQRLQRFSTNNAFKRTVLDMIANELLIQHMQQQAQLQQQQQQLAMQNYLAATGGKMIKTGSQGAVGSAGSQGDGLLAAAGGGTGPTSPTMGAVSSPYATTKGAPPGLMLDVSRPQVRSAAACSLLRKMNDKAATVHAGTLARNALLSQSLGGGSVEKGLLTYGHASVGNMQQHSPQVLRQTPQDSILNGSRASPMPIPTASQPIAVSQAIPARRPPPPSRPIPTGASAPVGRGVLLDSLPDSIDSLAAAAAAATDGSDHPSPVPPTGPRRDSEEIQLIANLPMPPHSVSPIAEHYLAAPPPKPASAATPPVTFLPPVEPSLSHGSRQRSVEGSGHALQHYAFLLAAGERSIHGLSQRSLQRSVSSAALHGMSHQASMIGHQPSMVGHMVSMPARASPGLSMISPGGGPSPSPGPVPQPSEPSMIPEGSDWSNRGMWYAAGSVHGTQDVKRLLNTVQKQRMEHRKLQRLMLDPSGRAQSNYQQTVLQRLPENDKATDGEAMEVDADTAAPRRTPTNTTNLPSVKSQSTMSASVPDGLSSMAPSVPQSVDVRQTALPGVDGAVKEGGDAAGVRDKGDKQGGLLHKVSKALLNPVKSLLKTHEQPGGTQTPTMDASNGQAGVKVVTAAFSGTASPALGKASTGLTAPSALSQAIANLENAPTLERTSRTSGATTPRAAAAAESAFGRAGAAEAAGLVPAAATEESRAGDESVPLEGGRRGQGAYAAMFGGARVAKGAPSVGAGSGTASGVSTPLGAPVKTIFEPEGVTGTSPGGPAKPPNPAGMPSIHKVKAHKRADAAAADDAQTTAAAVAEVPEAQSIAQQLARIEQAAPPDRGASDAAAAAAAQRIGGTVSRGTVFNMLGNLLGGPTQLAEFQNVLTKLQYDKNTELSFEQISEGLTHLGYHLGPQEVETLLGEVALGGQHLSQGAFLASQVDWREFQANHRDEWLACVRKAFDGLACKTDGKIREDQIVALLRDKLPEEEVNLAVQETLLDAAVLGAEGLDFDDFARLLAADSESDFSMKDAYGHPDDKISLASATYDDDDKHGFVRQTSLDLYDPRMDWSARGGKRPEDPAAGAAAAGAGVSPAAAAVLPPSWLAGALEVAPPHLMPNHYSPVLETVVDEEGD